MPSTKPQKSVNLDPVDHERAQRIADKLTENARKVLADPEHPETPLRKAVAHALQVCEREMGIKQ